MAEIITSVNNPTNWYWITILSLNILIFVTALALLILYYQKPSLFIVTTPVK